MFRKQWIQKSMLTFFSSAALKFTIMCYSCMRFACLHFNRKYFTAAERRWYTASPFNCTHRLWPLIHSQWWNCRHCICHASCFCSCTVAAFLPLTPKSKYAGFNGPVTSCLCSHSYSCPSPPRRWVFPARPWLHVWSIPCLSTLLVVGKCGG